jgi:hypothetical protein
MATVHNQIVSTNGNGSRSLSDRGPISPDEVVALIDATASELLGVSGHEACAMLDRGELDGTLAGGSLRSLRWLLDP